MKKKIILVITKSNWGGAQKYVFDMATSLSPEKYDIIVAMGGTGTLYQKLSEHGIRTIEIPSLGRDISFFGDLKAGAYLWKLFVTEKPDIVHLNSSKIGAVGSFMARMARVPRIVFTLHGLALNENRTFLSKKIIQCIYWMTLWFSHSTIAVSDALKRQSDAIFPLVGKKVHVVKNGIAPTRFYEKDEARAELLKAATQTGAVHPEYSIKSMDDFGSITIGIIGELHHIKGHQYLIEAFKSIISDAERKPELGLGTPKLMMLGEGEIRGQLEQQIDTLGLRGKAFLLGNIPEAAKYLKAFDIYVMSSLSEGLAYVVLEAGAAGLPIIATRVGGIPEIVNSEEVGFPIESKSSKALALALTDLITNKDHRDTLGVAIKQRIDTEFSLEKMVRETEAQY